MRINKIFCLILVLFITCGCTKNKNTEEKQPIDSGNISPYVEPVPDHDPIYDLGEGIKKKLENYFGPVTDAFIGESLNLFGKSIDIFDLTGLDIYGNEIDFSKYKDKKVMVEIAATYCNHCGEQLKYISRIKQNLGDTEILQIFADTNGNVENIEKFYAENSHKITDDATIIQFDYELTRRFLDIGITQTPLFLFIDHGVIKTAVTSFNSKFLEKICEIGFTDTIKREEIVDKNGRPLEEFYVTVDTILNMIKPESGGYLSFLNEYNPELTANVAGNKFDFNSLAIDYNGLIKKDSYEEYDKKNTIIFGLWRDDTANLEMDIRIINEFLKNNDDIQGLIVFIDDTEHFLTTSSDLYLKTKEKAICPTVSSESTVPQQIRDCIYNFFSSENVPMIMFVENNYITGLCAGAYSLNSLDTLKSLFFGPNCITLKENLIQNN